MFRQCWAMYWQCSAMFVTHAKMTYGMRSGKEFRSDKSAPTVKELQNEEIFSIDGFAKSGLMMFKDDYSGDDSLICCRLWSGKDKTGTVLDSEKIIKLLKESPRSAKELQAVTSYKSRSRFLEEIINPLIKDGTIFREGSQQSPTAVFRLK